MPVKKARKPRAEPMPPFPPQHQLKPGIEARMTPRPRFEAPDYRGSAKLAGRKVLIIGGDSGIGRAVAVLFAREGDDLANRVSQGGNGGRRGHS